MTTLLPWERLGSKVGERHLERLAVVYVRQSTRQQVADHGESTRLQYGLVERAVTLGWPASRVMVIDEDLGKSGSSAAGRAGFQRLVTEITLGHVGLVLGIEMSRLARSGADWCWRALSLVMARSLIVGMARDPWLGAGHDGGQGGSGRGDDVVAGR
jgi:DNA invertase Pin-like site-specific DNA recombinase